MYRRTYSWSYEDGNNMAYSKNSTKTYGWPKKRKQVPKWKAKFYWLMMKRILLIC